MFYRTCTQPVHGGSGFSQLRRSDAYRRKELWREGFKGHVWMSITMLQSFSTGSCKLLWVTFKVHCLIVEWFMWIFTTLYLMSSKTMRNMVFISLSLTLFTSHALVVLNYFYIILSKNNFRLRFVFWTIYIHSSFWTCLVNGNKFSGFEVADRGCCGTGTIEVTLLCNKLVKTCPDTTKYVFWDSFHPSETTYNLLVSPIIQRYISSFL